MVPKSRLYYKGCNPEVEPNYIDNEKTEIGKSYGNRFFTRLSQIVTEQEIGNRNNLIFYRRKIEWTEDKIVKTSHLHVDLNAGTNNYGKIAWNSILKKDITASVDIGNNNKINLDLRQNNDVVCGDNNILHGSFSNLNNAVVVGSDNILVNFRTHTKENEQLIGLSRLGSLMFSTEIVEPSSIGDTCIQVLSCKKVMLGREIFFGTERKAYVSRIVTKVEDGYVYFNIPIAAGETSRVGTRVFNEHYEVLPAFHSILERELQPYSKRAFFGANKELFLRDIKIGDNFITKVLFVRETDNMSILKNISQDVIPIGTEVSAEEDNPYIAWSVSIENIEDNKCDFSGKGYPFVGRTAIIENESYSITEFTENTISFDKPLPESVTSINFSEIEEYKGDLANSSKITTLTSFTNTTIPVEEPTNFFVGQTVYFSTVNTPMQIIEIGDNEIIVDNPVFTGTINNSFFVGARKLVVSTHTLEDLANNTAEFLYEGIDDEN